MIQVDILFSLPGTPLTPEQIEYIRERIDMKPYYQTIADLSRRDGIELETDTEEKEEAA